MRLSVTEMTHFIICQPKKKIVFIFDGTQNRKFRLSFLKYKIFRLTGMVIL